MSYHRSKETHPIVDILFSIAVIALVVTVVYGTSFIPWFSQVSHKIFHRSLQGQAVMSENVKETRNILLSSRKNMANQINNLNHEVFSLRAKVLDYERLQIENDSLRDMLPATPVSPKIISTVRVLKRPPASMYDTLIIGGGKAEGVMIGQKVVAFGTVYLGDVVEVFSDTALVRLATSQDVARDVRALRSGVILEAKGHNGSHVIIEMPREIDVSEKDQLVDVLSNKLSLVVYKITFDDREPFKTVYARSPVNMHYLDWVQVVQ